MGKRSPDAFGGFVDDVGGPTLGPRGVRYGGNNFDRLKDTIAKPLDPTAMMCERYADVVAPIKSAKVFPVIHEHDSCCWFAPKNDGKRVGRGVSLPGNRLTTGARNKEKQRRAKRKLPPAARRGKGRSASTAGAEETPGGEREAD